MQKLLYFLLIYSSFLQGHPYVEENSSLSLIAGYVHPLTCQIALSEVDGIAHGAEPIYLYRGYHASSYDWLTRSYKTWSLHDHMLLRKANNKIFSKQLNGSDLTYEIENNGNTSTIRANYHDTKGLMNTGAGILSGQTLLSNRPLA